jgi:hypothetical protein
MCYHMPSTSLSVCPRSAGGRKTEPSAREQVPHLVPHSVPPTVTAKRRWRGELHSHDIPKVTRQKTTPWPGATPFCGAFRAPKPLRAAGSLPAAGQQAQREHCWLATSLSRKKRSV